ncbi:MAG: caspase family protein [Candidatus Tectomicrobia bacterium]|nr:caspase family protein [Candidatus Tectomicrobia bacterium]
MGKMLSVYRIIGVIILGLALAGCATKASINAAITKLDSTWKEMNNQTLEKEGRRTFSVTRQQAFTAAQASVQRLGMVIEQQEYQTGFLFVSAPSPTPLTASEWTLVQQTDTQAMRSIIAEDVGDFLSLRATLDPSNRDLLANVLIADKEGGVQVSISIGIRDRNPTSKYAKRTQPPPTAVQIGLRKFWSVFEEELALVEKSRVSQVTATPTQSKESQPGSASIHFLQGMNYYDEGRYDLAIADFTKAIELDLKYVSAYTNRGLAYHRKDQYDSAIADFTKAIEFYPHALAYNKRGNVYADKRQYTQAIADYTRALELNPKYADAYYGRARAYELTGRAKEAIEAYQSFLKNAQANYYASEIEYAGKRIKELSRLPTSPPPTATPAVAKEPLDKEPPTIAIVIMPHDDPTKAITIVRGQATDPSGVANVMVNDVRVAFDTAGNFSKEVLLKEGSNLIVVTATDTHGNEARKSFTISGQLTNSRARERRLALVIGNSSYEIGQLANPVNDATDMVETLKTLGFEVTLLLDAAQREIERAIENFRKQLSSSKGVGLFYYAGHGIQVNGENYIVPIRARLNEELDVKYEAVPVTYVLDSMEHADNKLNIVILDACRTNPFTRRWTRSSSSLQGLASIQSATGTVIAYATAPNKVAADGSDRNGIYTKHLLRYITTPGLTINQVFIRVRVAVMEETNNKQIPWESTSLTGDLYLAGNLSTN